MSIKATKAMPQLSCSAKSVSNSDETSYFCVPVRWTLTEAHQTTRHTQTRAAPDVTPLHSTSFFNDVSCYLIFADRNHIHHPLVKIVLKIRGRLRINDAESSSNFKQKLFHVIVSMATR